jgi:hypothetical protein
MQNQNVYLKELLSMNNWEEGITQSKAKVGMTKIFVRKKLSQFRVDINDTDADLADQDLKLKAYKQYFTNLGDAPTVSEECLDKFLEFH